MGHWLLSLKWGIGMAVLVVGLVGCDPPRAQDLTRLDDLTTVDLLIKDHKFQCWVADNDDERMVGLMNVPADRMAALPDETERGMLFVFPYDQSARHGFWMKNTIIPLDIAFISSSGRIVTIRSMVPHDLNTTNPTGPYRYALEVNVNLFSKLGIVAGDSVEIPQAVLNSVE